VAAAEGRPRWSDRRAVGVSSGPVLPPPADLLDLLTECGVAFRSATEPIDTSAPMGRLLLQLLGIVDSNGK
jgi:hypothetical protein